MVYFLEKKPKGRTNKKKKYQPDIIPIIVIMAIII
jgi:hypothetical protein